LGRLGGVFSEILQRDFVYECESVEKFGKFLASTKTDVA
jgi:hypothetical protein